MKVFVKTSELTSEAPMVIACYADEVDIKTSAHGPDATLLRLPSEVIQSADRGPIMRLVKNWRERVGSTPVEAEAERRIREGFSASDQFNALYDMFSSLVKHGTDPTRWPEDVKQRKADYDRRWNYVNEVRSKAREHSAAMPRDIASDKIWPRRPS